MTGEGEGRRAGSILGSRASIRRLAFARLISSTGSSAAAITLPFVLYRQTRSGMIVAISFLLTFGIVGALAPIAGAIADRVDRQRLMIASDIAAAGIWSLMVTTDRPGWMLAIAFAASVAGLGFWSASSAAVPNLAPRGELTWANSLLMTANRTSAIIGPAIGGALLTAFGADATFLINSASFLVSSVLVATIRVPFSETPGADDTEYRGVLAGIRLIWRSPTLRILLIVWAFQYFAIDIAVVADPALATIFGVGAIGYGILEMGWGTGSVAGALGARRLPARFDGWAVAAGSISVVVCYGLISVTRWFASVVVLMAVVSLCDGFNTVAGQGILQRGSPDRVRGRVMSAVSTVGLLANSVAFPLAGVMVDRLGPRQVYAVGSAVAAASLPFAVSLLKRIEAPR